VAVLFALLAASPAPGSEMPRRTVGLWELTFTHNDAPHAPVQSAQHCVDAAIDRTMSLIWFHPDQKVCAKPDIKRHDGTTVLERTCADGSSRTGERAVITGDLNAAYTVQITTTEFIPADSTVVAITPNGLIRRQGPFSRDSRTTLEAEWLGACKIWMSPGDMFFPHGKVNLREWPLMPQEQRK
jgi:hypothetical protein